ncbi:SpoIIE family protein phosphatase [Actinomadura rupiterrae]|uniref:SpoIIE family protein phosphatase n=1 Tax=Actinomadura rupiterrae TaxID=559627 RepID=UPI0020A57613|nr:SpoIIE family protein phosphatase [Actinomadura rupiterrae]MCP2340939.1 serine phosphatase RsbU (regulator of sigma subunit)/anti-sigma regulatory factor (Ser/Thr protein kinase) [Actinomadura rupiterrae]
MDRQTAAATFPSAAASVADARRFVQHTLREWGMAEAVDDAVLATSELATNAVAYAGTAFDVSCTLTEDEIQIEVRDRHPTRTPVMPGVTAASGRGLPSIARLAASWGVDYDHESKGIWFRLPRPGAEPEEPPTDDFARRPGFPVRPDSGGAEPAAPGASGGRTAADPGWGVPETDSASAGRPRPDLGTSNGRAHRPGGATRPAGAKTRARPSGLGSGTPSARRPEPPALPTASDRLLRTPAGVESLEDALTSVRDLLDAEGAAILLTERDGTLVVAASAGLTAEPGPDELSVVNLGPDARAGAPWIAADASDPVAAALRARSMAAAPLESQGRLTGLVVAVSTEPGRFEPADAARLGRIAEEMALSLEKARVGELERSWRGWLSFVAEASDLLAGTLDQERTMALVAQLVVPRLATWCAVYTDTDAGPPALAYVWHADETRADGLRSQLDRAAQGPRPDVPGPWYGLAEVTGPDAAGTVYAFPLVARGRRIGALVIGRPMGDRFPRSAIELAEELSRRAALAVDNARLYSAQTAMSSALQRSLLPPGVPDIPGLEVAVVYEPAGEGSEVGGDFYDVFECPERQGGPGGPPVPGPVDRWRFAIGDVCGTGPQAAAVTGLARHALRILAAEELPVPGVLARLNRLILGEGERGRLLTLLHGEITPRPRRDGVTIALTSAGHPPPLVLDPDGSVREVGTAQPLLGVFDGVDFHADDVELHRGQVLLCVTDGVTERRHGGRLLGDDGGLERLLAGCTGLSAGAVAARIQRAVRDFGPEPSNDDVALIVLRAS